MTSFQKWLVQMFTRRRGRRQVASRPSLYRPALEILEDRLAPATLTVLNTTDSSAGSLRSEIGLAANGDQIVFDPTVFATPQIIVLNSTLTISRNVTITGPSEGVTIDGNNASTVFQVNSGVTATLNGLTIAHGRATTGGGINNSGTLTIQSSTLSGNSATNGGGIYNSGTLTVQSSTLSGNSTPASGGGVDNTGTLTIAYSTLSGNDSDSGGAIANAGTLTLQDDTFSTNIGLVGGAISNSGTLTVQSSTLFGNTATLQAGGGILNSGTLTVLNSTITGNTAGHLGAGIDNSFAGATLIGTIVVGNLVGSTPYDLAGATVNTAASMDDLIGTAGTSGLVGGSNGNQVGVTLAAAGLSALGWYGGPTQTIGLLPGSAAIGMGVTSAIASTDQRGIARPLGSVGDVGAFQSQNGIVVNTTADSSGPAAFGLVSLRDAVNLANANTSGTAETITFDPTVFTTPQTITLSAGTLTLSNTRSATTIQGPATGLTIDGNNAVTVFHVNVGVTATLGNLTIAHGNGFGTGGIYNTGTLTVQNCTLTGNTSSAASGAVGGIDDASGTLTVQNCTFLGNTGTDGGAIGNNLGTVMVQNSTFLQNSATQQGGAIYDHGGTLTVQNSTLTGNTAAMSGGAIYLSFGNTALTGTIVVGNLKGAAASDIAGNVTVSTAANDLIGTGGSDGIANGSNGNQVGVTLAAAGLSALGNFGGPTQTIALLPGSAAIGKGVTSAIASTDQRGIARPLGTAGDVGAFQSQNGIVVNTTADSSGPAAFGLVSLRDAVNLANANTTRTGETITFDPTVFATPQTITLTGGSLVLTNRTAPLTITGPAAGVTIDGNNAVTVFQINPIATATFTGLTIAHGAGLYVGGIANDGTLTVQFCTLAANTGGIENLGTLTVQNSSLIGNTSDGAIANFGTLTVQNSTLSGNSASKGGGLIGELGSMTIQNSTLYGNYATYSGGGIYTFSGTPILTGTIVVGNRDRNGADQVQGINGLDTVNSMDNVIGTGGSGGLSNGSNGNQVGVSVAQAGLGTLGFYGGTTETIPLLPGSAAIDKGVTSAVASTDERGVARPINSPSDVGAFQSLGFTVTVSGGSNQSTDVSKSFAAPLQVSVAATHAGDPVDGGTITFTPPGSGASATLTGTPATISGGFAQVTATPTARLVPTPLRPAPPGPTRRTSILTNNPPPSITTTSLAAWTSNQPGYSQIVAASGGTGPFTFALTSGTLPSGLSLDANSGAITGTPLSLGTSSFTVQVTDADRDTVSANLSITINPALTLAPTVLPGGSVGGNYSATITASGGTGSVSLTTVVTAGSIPAGLSITGIGTPVATVMVRGIPMTAGTVSFIVTATDSVGLKRRRVTR